jgi:hypothetical protein
VAAADQGGSQIYACVNNSSGTIHVIDATATCGGNEMKLIWNTQGPQGVPGPQGLQGPQGIQGVQGVPGADGKTVLHGAGAPAAALGSDGDFYLDTAANAIYGPKTAGAWGSATSLVGPQGAKGDTGAQGIQGIQGPQGDKGDPGAQGNQGERGPSDGWTSVRAFGSPVPITLNADTTVTSRTLPAGSFLLNGYVDLHNTSSTDGAAGYCYLSGNSRLAVYYDLPPGVRMELPLTASESASVNWAFEVRCQGASGSAEARSAFATAVQVGVLH